MVWREKKTKKETQIPEYLSSTNDLLAFEKSEMDPNYNIHEASWVHNRCVIRMVHWPHSRYASRSYCWSTSSIRWEPDGHTTTCTYGCEYQMNGISLTHAKRIKASIYEVVAFQGPKSWRVTSHDDISTEAIFHIQGILCAFELPPVYTKWVNWAQRACYKLTTRKKS